MRYILVLTAGLFVTAAHCQIINKQNQQIGKTITPNSKDDISATENSITISTKLIYNAIPDGYHVTYTKSFIGKTVEDVEVQMNNVVSDLIKSAQSLEIHKQDVVVDMIALDPIFNITLKEPADNYPIGYKVTQNITFNVKSIATIGPLSKKCLDHGIFDLINVEAYLIDSKVIYDTLYSKAVEILDMKKKLCTQIGWSFTGGGASFVKNTDVIYPNERYLSSYASNANLYQHHIAENTAIKLDRTLDVDNFFNFNLKNADFVFHADKTIPVIQFYYQLDYSYNKVVPKLAKAKEEDKTEKIFYILDKSGNLKKIEM